MKTITIQIGNSDNKLTQQEWSAFIYHVFDDLLCVMPNAEQIHFSGGSNPAAKWQNYCWVFNLDDERIPEMREWLSSAAYQFKQDSIAMTVGDTEFVAATP